jgi:hypothetical protein
MAGVGPQFEADAACVAHGLQPVLGHADKNLELFAARQLHHALALSQHLADLGQHRRDDARGIGTQLGVGEIVLRRGELAPGLVDLGLRGRGDRLTRVERLGHEGGTAAQRLVAHEVGLGAGIVGLGRGEGRTRIVDGEAVVGGIDAGNQLAGLHDGADIDVARDHLAGDAEPQSRLDARHDGAGEHQAVHVRAELDLGHAGRADDGRWRRRCGGGGAFQVKAPSAISATVPMAAVASSALRERSRGKPSTERRMAPSLCRSVRGRGRVQWRRPTERR